MRFNLNQAGIRRVAQGAGVTRFVNTNARRVLQQAKATPGVDDEFLASLAMVPAVEGSDAPATVESDSPFWHLHEYGSINNPPTRPLSRAVTDAGLEFEPA